MKTLEKCLDVKFCTQIILTFHRQKYKKKNYLMFKELVFQSFVPSIGPCSFKQCRIFSVVLGNSLHLLIVISAGQCSQTIRVQLAATRVQLLTIILGQFSAK